MDATPNGLDRRPIAARRLAVMHRLARACAKAGISPNAISIVGLVACIAAGVLIALPHADDWTQRGMLVLAAGLIQLRLLCNLIDGMVAVEGGLKTPTGELFNEVPDRLSDAAVLIGVGYAVGSSPTLGWIAAMSAVFVAYLRAVGKGAGLSNDFRGPMAKQQRMAIVTFACLYVALAPASWQPALPPFHHASSPGAFTIALVLIIVGCAITSLRRLRGIANSLIARSIAASDGGEPRQSNGLH